MAVWTLLFLLILYGFGTASHFRGAVIQWKPLDDGQVSNHINSLFLLLNLLVIALYVGNLMHSVNMYVSFDM